MAKNPFSRLAAATAKADERPNILFFFADDQRNHTLTLYFSRSLKRGDYAMAKIAAVVTGLLILTLIPQTVLFIGNALAGNDIPKYIEDNWQDIAPVFGAGLLISLFMAGISLAIAAQTPRRAYATGAILAYWAITTTVGGIVVNISNGALQKYSALISGFHTMRGLTFWMFDFTPTLDDEGNSNNPGGDLVLAGLDFYWYAVLAVAIVALTFWLVYRRYQKIAA